MGLSRRGFVLGALATPVVATLPRTAWTAPGGPWRFFDAHQAAVVEAATARLIPGPTDDVLELGDPGAREANVVGFIDGFLGAFTTDPPTIYAGGPFSGRHGGDPGTNDFARFVPLSPTQDRYWRATVTDLQATYTRGIAGLDAAGFLDAAPLQQDLILTADASGFRDVLFDHAIQGWLAAPEYGGNADGSGWVAVRFPGDVCPDGYTDAQVSNGDGLDVIDPTGVLTDVVDRLRGILGA